MASQAHSPLPPKSTKEALPVSVWITMRGVSDAAPPVPAEAVAASEGSPFSSPSSSLGRMWASPSSSASFR
eukprot:14908021-Alexandrium_andersonii.AAC.1